MGAVMAKRDWKQLDARWQEVTRRLWVEEKAMLAGVITREEQLQADQQHLASRRALEIEARRMREAEDAVVKAAG